MELHAKLVRSQLSFFKPFVAGLSLEATRKGQDKLGELMTALHRREVLVRDHDFEHFQGAWVMPKDQRRTGVILYLHGGGYTCGSLEYAKGFAAALASECGVRVFCPAYRLAPEHPYPAALDDALESYQYLLQKGYEPGQVMLAGESAGGGLIYCLCLKLKELGMELPCGLIGISPWTDLTGSGDSYRENRENDPSMTPELLQFYAGCYTENPADPLCSPLFGDLTGLPPSLLFVGGDEVMLDDTRALHNRLLSAGCRSKLHIAPERWHAYVLYCLNENMEQDFEAINHFLDRTLSPARSLRWMRLDNAAKIYPAAKRRNWNNFFRLSATLTEPIDVPVLRAALDVTRSRRKPVKVLLPVNLRTLFPSRSLRNFASYITPEIDPRTGDYTFSEICAAVHHRMGLENNTHTLRSKFAANVASEKSPVLKVMPLFIKNIAMKAVFDTVGERKSCLCLSNLGAVELPEAMAPYVQRLDFIIGVQAAAPHDCGVVSWNGTMYINCIRSIQEPELELHFYRVLQRLGLPVKVESNRRGRG